MTWASFPCQVSGCPRSLQGSSLEIGANQGSLVILLISVHIVNLILIFFDLVVQVSFPLIRSRIKNSLREGGFKYRK